MRKRRILHGTSCCETGTSIIQQSSSIPGTGHEAILEFSCSHAASLKEDIQPEKIHDDVGLDLRALTWNSHRQAWCERELRFLLPVSCDGFNWAEYLNPHGILFRASSQARLSKHISVSGSLFTSLKERVPTGVNPLAVFRALHRPLTPAAHPSSCSCQPTELLLRTCEEADGNSKVTSISTVSTGAALLLVANASRFNSVTILIVIVWTICIKYSVRTASSLSPSRVHGQDLQLSRS